MLHSVDNDGSSSEKYGWRRRICGNSWPPDYGSPYGLGGFSCRISKSKISKHEISDPTYIESGNDTKKGYTAVQELLKGNPNLKGILCCEGATPSSAGQIVEEKNLIGKLFVSGLALPSTVKNYLESGAISNVSCSNPINQSYCLGVVALAALQGIKCREGDYYGRTGYNILKLDGKGLTVGRWSNNRY